MSRTRARRLAPRAIRRPVLVTAAVTAVASAVGLAGLAGAVGPVGVAPTSAEPADTLVTPARPAAPVTPVRIGQLDRGEGPTVPRVVGTALVEGDRVVDVDADEVLLLGVSGTDRVVATYADGAPPSSGWRPTAPGPGCWTAFPTPWTFPATVRIW